MSSLVGQGPWRHHCPSSAEKQPGDGGGGRSLEQRGLSQLLEVAPAPQSPAQLGQGSVGPKTPCPLAEKPEGSQMPGTNPPRQPGSEQDTRGSPTQPPPPRHPCTHGFLPTGRGGPSRNQFPKALPPRACSPTHGGRQGRVSHGTQQHGKAPDRAGTIPEIPPHAFEGVGPLSGICLVFSSRLDRGPGFGGGGMAEVK